MSGDGRLTQERLRELRRAAIAVRRHLIDAVHHAGAGHLGGPLSAADILVALYFELLRIDPQDPQDLLDRLDLSNLLDPQDQSHHQHLLDPQDRLGPQDRPHRQDLLYLVFQLRFSNHQN